MYDRMPPKLPFYWNSVIPATLDTALTFDEMQSKIVWTVNKILENQYLTVPYLISLGTEYTTTSISIKGILFQNYTPLQVDKEFVINGMKDGTYYINVFNDAANTEAGKPPVQSNDLLFLSTEYMPKNCTSLYVFDILNGNIVGNSIRYNDLYTEMHNADPNAHQALFEAVYNKIEEESDGLHNEIVTETNRAKQAEQQLQDNIDNESAARQQADTTLQNNINAEKTAREQADTALGKRITAETTARQQADTNLQNSINAEKTAREQADTTLQNNINAEKTARENADTALGERITAETTARQQADTNLQNSINAEKTARKQADTTLQNNINAEKTARENADTELQDSINTHIQNKNNPHNVTADQIGNVVKTINNLVNNITVNGSRGTSITNDSNTITVNGSMIDVPSDTNLDIATEVGIYALSANIQYTSSYSGLPNKAAWLYMLVYKVGTAIKQIIYNGNGTAYRRDSVASDWVQINYGGGGGTAGVSSINSLTGALTLNGDQGVSVTNTGNALQVRGQYYVRSQNSSVNATLRPGITTIGSYSFTDGPENETLIAIETVDRTSGSYNFFQVGYCLSGHIYVRRVNTNGTATTGWIKSGVFSFNNRTGNINVDGRYGNIVVNDVSGHFFINGPLVRNPTLDANAVENECITSFDYDTRPTNIPSSSNNPVMLFQVRTDAENTNQYFTQWLIDKTNGKTYIRTKNKNGTQTTPWALNSYSAAVDNTTITLDSLAPSLSLQNLTLELEEYRGTKYKAKFYVPFAVSNSNSPLTEIALWSLPEGWAFDEDQYIPLYIRSVSSGASSFGYIQCSNNAMQLIIGGTGQSIPAGWVVRFCNSDVYLVKSGA